MDQTRRILYLCDPLRTAGETAARLKNEYPNVTALVFCENERWLPKAQRAFCEGGYSAVAAEGHGCIIALAVAAQLPVDELLLRKCALFDRRKLKNVPARLRRIASFARRNLSLVVSQIWLADTDETEKKLLSTAVSSHARIEFCAENGGIGAFFQR